MDSIPLEASGLTKSFGGGRTFPWQEEKEPVVAISDVSFQIKRGEIFGLISANGSGKMSGWPASSPSRIAMATSCAEVLGILRSFAMSVSTGPGYTPKTEVPCGANRVRAA